MKRQAKALSAGSNLGRGYRPGFIRRALVLTALALLALALTAASASAEYVEVGQLSGSFGSLKSESVAVDDANGHIFVADSSTGLLYDFASASDASPTIWDGSTTPAGSFGGGTLAVAADNSTGDVYVADSTHGVIDKFDQTGTLISSFGDTSPTPDGQLAGLATPAGSFLPAATGSFGIAVDQANGDLYAIDAGHQVIDVFDSSGAYLRQITATPAGLYGCEGNYADGIAVNGATGHVFVSDSCPVQAFEFDAAGAYVQTLNGIGTPDGSFGGGYTSTAASNSTGSVYVVDSEHEVVDRFDSSGNYLDQIEGHPANAPAGIAVDQATRSIYIADSGSGVVNAFEEVKRPEITTGGASNVQATSATVDGELDPAGNGDIITCAFEYGTTESYGETVSCSPPTPYSTPTEISADLSGLEPNTTYHYRVSATSTDPGVGKDRTFTTHGPPLLRNEKPLRITDTSATVGGELYSGLTDTTYHVEYGLDEGYGAIAPVPDAGIGSGSGFHKVSIKFTGLQSEHTYHWRLVATNQYGSVQSADHSLTTEGALSDDNIPRPPGAIDNRGWELVSQAEKNSQQLFGVKVPTADGNKIAYGILGGVPGGIAGGNNPYLATRTAGGWQTSNLLPSHDRLVGGVNYLSAFTPDYSKVAIASEPGLAFGIMAWYSWDDKGNFATLRPTGPFDGEMIDDASLSASEDLSRIFASVDNAYPSDPSHVPGTYNIYDVAAPGAPQLVSRMPGSGLAPACGADHPREWGDRPGNQHQVASDGSRVFFTSRGDVCSDPSQLYLRDLGDETTQLISGPPQSGDPDTGVESLHSMLQAAPDGSWAIYRTATSLDPADDVDGNPSDLDIYRYDLGVETNTCLTCVVPNAEVLAESPNAAEAEASEDGSHVYFLSDAAYGGAPSSGSEGEHNVYVWQDGSIEFIARTRERLASVFFESQVTSNGKTIVFKSASPAMDGLSDSENGGFTQVYRYDDTDGSLTCVSCPAGEATAESEFGISSDPGGTNTFPNYRLVSDDGSMVFFSTLQSLVPQDVNGDNDIYEWHDGRTKLITDGISQGANLGMISVTPDGHDFFFTDTAELVAQAQDATNKLYDARIDGGFPPPTEAPAPCDGDACQGPLQAAPGASRAASAGFSGPGNVRAKKAKAKKRHQKKKHHKRSRSRADHNRRASR